MKKRSILGFLAILSLLGWSPCLSLAGGLDLTVVHVNDTHSHMEPVSGRLKINGAKTYLKMGGAARMAARVNQLRAQGGNLLFLHAGDATQGTLYFTKYNGEVEMKLLNDLGLSAMVVGNHEFDRGPIEAARILGLADFPILGANVDASAEEALAGKIKPYVIKETGGAKVGLVGLVTPHTKDISSPGDKVKFGDPVEAAKKAVADLTAAGVDKIILINHLGYRADLDLAAKVDGIDLIVGGHSHSLLGDSDALGQVGMRPRGEYPTQVKGPSGAPVYIVQSWEWAKAVGVLDLSFDDKGVITEAEGRTALLVGGPFRQKNKEGKKVALEGQALADLKATLTANPAVAIVEPDPQTVAFMKPYKEGVEALQKQVVAKITQDLFHVREPGPHPSGKVLASGSHVAPLVTAAMFERATRVGLQPDLVLQNAGGVRTDLLAGDLTVGQVHSLMPFANTLILLELSGKEVKEAILHGVLRGGGAFPYLAGARLILDPTKPKAERAIGIELAGPDGTWKPLDEGSTYRLVTNSFVANGGDGYKVFKEAKGYKYDTGFIDALVFGKFVRGKELGIPEQTGVVVKGE